MRGGDMLPGFDCDPWARPAGAGREDETPPAAPIPGDVPLIGDVAPGEYQTWAPRGAGEEL